MAVRPFLVNVPKPQFFNAAGTAPLSGGQVFIYSPGTTTPLNTYPTSANAVAGTNPNTNPIILDSSGRPSVDIYVSGAYKMVVAASNDTTPPTAPIWTEDNITSLVPAISTTNQSSNYTLVSTDINRLFECDSSAGSITIILPAAATAGNGYYVIIKKTDTTANTVTVQANGSEHIDGSNTIILSIGYQAISLYCDGTQWLSANQPLNGFTVSSINVTNVNDVTGKANLVINTAPTTTPISIKSGTNQQHTANFVFTDSANSFNYTFFDASDTLVGLSQTQTLSNKTYLYVSANITASTTHTQAGATAITTDMVYVTTSNASDAVVLPVAVAGRKIEIVNASANAGVVYGNGSDTINGTAGATGVAYAASKTLTCRCFTAGAWVTVLSN